MLRLLILLLLALAPPAAAPGGNHVRRYACVSAKARKIQTSRVTYHTVLAGAFVIFAVVGVRPGDRVACCDEEGRVTVNGVSLDETYILEDSPLEVPPNPGECRSRRFDEVVVPPGQIFVLGDHRLVSQDARCQGPVPIDNVIGRAFIIVWPSARWTSLPVPSTFDSLQRSAVSPAAPGGNGPGADEAPGSPAPSPQPAPTNPDSTGGIAIIGPMLGILAITARSRHSRSARHRRLHP